MKTNINHKLSIPFLLIVILLSGNSIIAAPFYITQVPDWDQPVFAGTGVSASGSWGAWCVPTAMANIVGYYDDKGVAGIGDNQPFPTSAGWPDTLWQDETADATGGARSDLGWWFNTNDLGKDKSPSPAHRGTKIQHILNGAAGSGGLIGGGSGYFPSRGQSDISVRNLGADTMNSTIYTAFNTHSTYPGPQSNHTYGFAFSEITLALGTNGPILAHFDHFNLMSKTRANDPTIGDYDWADWAPPPSYGPGGHTDENSDEVWDPNRGLGHTVTVVGFFTAADPCNPFVVDAIIVHDNWDGTLTAISPLPLVLPWTASPWAGLTIIDHGLQQPELIDPNGGEAWVAESNYTVSWTNTGTIADIDIEYSTNNGAAWSNVSPPNSGNSGTYQWTTPVADSNQCLVRISSAVTSALFDTSDDVFTIYECTLFYDLDGDCWVTMTDFALFASEWLECGNSFDPECTQP